MSKTEKGKEKKRGPATEAEAEAKEEALEEILEELEEEAEERKEETAEEAGSTEIPVEDGEAEADAAEETPKKKLFGKKEKENPLQKKLEEIQDKYMRQVAEFDNFRKRTDKEKSQMFEQGQMNVLEKLLPVVDNFERAMAAAPTDEASKAFVEGVDKIYRQTMKMMEDLGVAPIDAVGEEFDPNYHNAVMQTESEEYESGTVATELQKGYMFHENVLRHSMVAVVQ